MYYFLMSTSKKYPQSINWVRRRRPLITVVWVSAYLRIDLLSLKQHFLTNIESAKKCFDQDKLKESIIELRDECGRGVEESKLLSSLVKLTRLLNDMYVSRRTSIALFLAKSAVYMLLFAILTLFMILKSYNFYNIGSMHHALHAELEV